MEDTAKIAKIRRVSIRFGRNQRDIHAEE